MNRRRSDSGRVARAKALFRGIAAGLLTLLSAPLVAQQRSPVNLQVLPTDISRDSLGVIMGGFTRALGVGCIYCHVARNGRRPEPDEFELDDKETKVVARAMLRMVDGINHNYLPATGRVIPARHAVTCATCHRGIARPRTLEVELLDRYDEAGLDSTVILYRQLRTALYGRAAYDFSDITLPTAADLLAKSPASQRDALELYKLNLEFYPESWFTYQQLGQLQTAMADTASAIASYRRALEINPSRALVRQLLEALQRP